MYHGFGLLNALLVVLSIGGSVHLAGDAAPAEAWEMIDERQIRVLYGWPVHFQSLIERGSWAAPGPTPLEWCVSSSSPLDAEVAARFEAQTGCRVHQQYGTTETGPLSLDGVAFGGVEIQILGADGRPVPAGEEGRVGVRMLDEASDLDLVLDNGWFLPGDVGRKDARGRLCLSGRHQPLYDERSPLVELR